MMERRRFLGLLGSAPAWAWACASDGGALDTVPVREGAVVTDVQSGLEGARVARILAPRSNVEVRAAIGAARQADAGVALSGARHAMGGQQFLDGGWLLDLRGLDRVVAFDDDLGQVTVGTGNTWSRVVEFLSTTWSDDGSGWTIVQRPPVEATIGGSLASNVHGMALGQPPLVGNVERIALIDADGAVQIASREENAALFQLAIGGYGLFGPIVEATLRLRPRVKTRKLASEETIDTAITLLRDRSVTGDLYGDFVFSVDLESYTQYLRRGVLTTYRRVELDTPILQEPRRTTAEEWTERMRLAHLDPASVTRMILDQAIATDGQIQWCDEVQKSAWNEGYHAALEAAGVDPGADVLVELFLPSVSVESFMSAARAVLRGGTTPVVHARMRMIEPDDTTFLPYARQRFACVEFRLHVGEALVAREVADATVRELIDEALERDGSFYLTYGRAARPDQLLEAYPRFEEFLAMKRLRDREGRFQSEWYRHWVSRLGATPAGATPPG